MTTILITGSTDGIGFATADMLLDQGATVLLHGRSPGKLKAAKAVLADRHGADRIASYLADLSVAADVERLAADVARDNRGLDVLINNAGVYAAPGGARPDGLDPRFVVNTIAPYLLARLLLPTMNPRGRIVNLSSAAQSSVDPQALTARQPLSDGAAYAQSKFALTIWTQHLAAELGESGPAVIAVNPASMLGSKMVKEAYGIAGGNLDIGADILTRVAISHEFADASGRYYDNDRQAFAAPHPDGGNPSKVESVMAALKEAVAIFTR